MNTDMRSLIADLKQMYYESHIRRISLISKWASEMLYSICQSQAFEEFSGSEESAQALPPAPTYADDLSVAESAQLTFCHSCFDCQEFDRAAAVVQNSRKLLFRFLYFYARYLASEKKRLDTEAEVTDKTEKIENDDLESILVELSKLYEENRMDSWLLYLYGIVLRSQGMLEDAELVLVKSINENPLFWGAWLELTHLVKDAKHLSELELSSLQFHWLKKFFMAQSFIQLYLASEAQSILEPLLESPKSPFASCPYLLGQLAAAHHSLTPPGLDQVIDLFEKIRAIDPYRLDGMDLYSNTLFVKGMRVELASLAHHVFNVNKFCLESCCVVGNYFALRSEHERAILYFQRAIKLDPKNAGAWVLIGHEFMELQNQPAATLAYRKAINVDPRDYRAWYGLGQAYEIAKMPSWALYYHRQAHRLRPLDSRFLVALGEVYEKLGQISDATKAYWKAHSVGDVEGMALIKLGKLYESQKETEQAASVFALYLDKLDEQKLTDEANQPDCCLFLGNYCLEIGELEEAHKYAQKCLEYEKTKEDASEILKRISALRLNESDAMQLDESLTEDGQIDNRE